MSWEAFMQMERRQLWERRKGKLRRALGVALSGESVEELDRLGKQDQLRAEQGLVIVVGEGGRIFYKHIDDLSRHDMRFRTVAEWVEVAWLKESLHSPAPIGQAAGEGMPISSGIMFLMYSSAGSYLYIRQNGGGGVPRELERGRAKGRSQVD